MCLLLINHVTFLSRRQAAGTGFTVFANRRCGRRSGQCGCTGGEKEGPCTKRSRRYVAHQRRETATDTHEQLHRGTRAAPWGGNATRRGARQGKPLTFNVSLHVPLHVTWDDRWCTPCGVAAGFPNRKIAKSRNVNGSSFHKNKKI